MELKELSIGMLLAKYKNKVRSAPSVFYSDDEEMDKYYDELLAFENEIKRRINENE
jgi:hypothetical protein